MNGFFCSAVSISFYFDKLVFSHRNLSHFLGSTIGKGSIEVVVTEVVMEGQKKRRKAVIYFIIFTILPRIEDVFTTLLYLPLGQFEADLYSRAHQIKIKPSAFENKPDNFSSLEREYD